MGKRKVFQGLINTGQAWRLGGAVGREAMELINEGMCVLGRKSQKDFYGNVVPSRYDVKDGTKGSEKYAKSNGYDII